MRFFCSPLFIFFCQTERILGWFDGTTDLFLSCFGCSTSATSNNARISPLLIAYEQALITDLHPAAKSGQVSIHNPQKRLSETTKLCVGGGTAIDLVWRIIDYSI